MANIVPAASQHQHRYTLTQSKTVEALEADRAKVLVQGHHAGGFGAGNFALRLALEHAMILEGLAGCGICSSPLLNGSTCGALDFFDLQQGKQDFIIH